jgi:hypothetical protein
MVRHARLRDDLSMALLDRQLLLPAIQGILDAGCWCVYEVCLDVPRQVWEPRALICHRDPVRVVEAIAAESNGEPMLDARLIGCDRVTLRHDQGIAAQLCYIAERLMPPRPPRRHRERS